MAPPTLLSVQFVIQNRMYIHQTVCSPDLWYQNVRSTRSEVQACKLWQWK
uniref:Uncharacterized protein n=1 Tax=Anguilla anguilla TaxID=7936 RepID=A0A0E9PSN7_ANGAN